MSSQQPDDSGIEPAVDSEQPAHPSANLPGAQLLAERREQGLSLGDVARQLKLSVRQVEALERDEYAAFPGPVFVRGFLRNYAKLLQLDPEALVAQAAIGPIPAAASPSVVATPVPLQDAAAPRRGRFGFGTLALGLVVVIVVLAAIYDSRNKPAPVSLAPVPAPSAPARSPEHADSPPPSAVATNVAPPSVPPAPTPVTTAALPETAAPGVTPAVPATAAAPVVSGAPSAPTAPATPAAPAPQAASPATAAPAAAVAGAEIKLDFDDESWVEIKDGTGAVIFARLNPAGAQQMVSGEPPLDVVIGNARSVRMTYRNKPVDLGPHTRVDVARVRLD